VGDHGIEGAQVTSMILPADAAAEDRVTITTSPGQDVTRDWYQMLGATASDHDGDDGRNVLHTLIVMTNNSTSVSMLVPRISVAGDDL
jgi:hypothetical protein